MNAQTNILLRMIIAHIVADFVFQPKHFIESRKDKKWLSFWLYLHGFIYSMFLYVAASKWGQAFWIIPCFFFSHVVIDGIKSTLEENTGNFVFDQFAHLFIIFAVWITLSGNNLSNVTPVLGKLWNSKDILLVMLGYLIILWPTGYFLAHLLKPFQQRLKQERKGLEKAGLWIGLLERFLAYSFILGGHLEAIGFLVAAKSVFRFGEIKDPQNREEAEYILIGTLLSFVIAITVGYVIKIFTKY